MKGLWSAWSNNCGSVSANVLYIGHAWLESKGGKQTLCGVKIQEIGQPIGIEEIGCVRCKKSRWLKE